MAIDEIGDVDRLPLESARHVDGCQACSAFAAELAGLRSLLREQGRVTAPDDFDLQLSRRLRNTGNAGTAPAAPFGWLSMPQWGVATAAAALLVVAGAYGVLQSNSTAPQPASGPAVALVQPEAKTSGPSIATDGGFSGQEIARNDERTPELAVAIPSTIRTSSRRSSAAQSAARNEGSYVLVRDAGGVRVVDVPPIIVGAERAVPASRPDSELASLDERVAF